MENVYKTMERFVNRSDSFNIPQLQQKFDTDYTTVKKFINKMLKDKSIEYVSGLQYRSVTRNQAGAKTDLSDVAKFLVNHKPPEPPQMRNKYLQVLLFTARHREISASMIIKQLSIGYVLSTRILDWMESAGFISHLTGLARGYYLVNIKEPQFVKLYGNASRFDYDEDDDYDEEDDEDDDDDDEDDEDSDEQDEDDDKKDIDTSIEGILSAVINTDEQEKKEEDKTDPPFAVFDEINKLSALFRGAIINTVLNGDNLIAKAHNLLYSNGKEAQFRLYQSDGKTFLSDSGFAYENLLAKPGYGEVRAKNTLTKNVEGTHFELNDKNELTLEIKDGDNAAAKFYLFYWFIDCLI